jgi:hypothetical protein
MYATLNVSFKIKFNLVLKFKNEYNFGVYTKEFMHDFIVKKKHCFCPIYFRYCLLCYAMLILRVHPHQLQLHEVYHQH